MGKHMQGKPAAWNRRSSHSAAVETATTAIGGGEERGAARSGERCAVVPVMCASVRGSCTKYGAR